MLPLLALDFKAIIYLNVDFTSISLIMFIWSSSIFPFFVVCVAMFLWEFLTASYALVVLGTWIFFRRLYSKKETWDGVTLIGLVFWGPRVWSSRSWIIIDPVVIAIYSGIYQKVHTLMQLLPIKYVLYNGCSY